MESELFMWTIYDRPRDYPSGFIARPFTITANGPRPAFFALTAQSLAEIRNMLPPGLVRIERDPAGEPHIVECWL